MGKAGEAKKQQKPSLSDEELAVRVRATLDGKALNASQLKKGLGKDGGRALVHARELAALGELVRVGAGAHEWFFGADPIAMLDRVVPALLHESGPLPIAKLKAKPFKAAIEAAAPGHAAVLDEWLKGALGRERLFEIPQRGGQKPAVLLGPERPKRETDEEIWAKIRTALTDGGQEAAELAQLVDEIDAQRAVQLARDRAASGELHRVAKGKLEWFFVVDPIATLDRVVPALLRDGGPLTIEDLKAPVERAAPGHAALLADWQARAVGRGLAFELRTTRAKKKPVVLLSASDPTAILDRVVPALLRESGPAPATSLTRKAFTAEVERAAPGYSALLGSWLGDAVARSVLFEWPPATAKKATGKSSAALLGADRPPAPLSNEQLAAKVKNALHRRGMKSAELAKVMGDADAARALDIAREAAEKGALRRVVEKGIEWFFGADPIATLDRVVPDILRRQGPLALAGLKEPLEAAAPGHFWLLKQWLAGAQAREMVFELSQPGPPNTKVLSHEPSLELSLSKALDALNEALPLLERHGITRERALDFLRGELGIASRPAARTERPPAPPSSKRTSREVFLEALRRFADDNPKGALLPVRELRARAGLGKQDFDSAALDLSKEGLLVLHHHDHAAALSEAEQSGLVRDALGRHYVGIALRGSA
ncbi:MAG TPA: hypothetical protein VMG12_06480 [Polyangiaceae bacterium]|nr:hypothetical protein [Polyangiaceae bacterium]